MLGVSGPSHIQFHLGFFTGNRLYAHPTRSEDSPEQSSLWAKVMFVDDDMLFQVGPP